MTPDLSLLTALSKVNPHLRAAIESARSLDATSAHRKLDRALRGCCPCGLAPGEAYCPICEGVLGGSRSLGRWLREDGKTLAEIVETERAVIEAARNFTIAGNSVSPRKLAELALDLAEHTASRAALRGPLDVAVEAFAAIGAKKKPADVAPSRPPNRHERRRARSRRWRG